VQSGGGGTLTNFSVTLSADPSNGNGTQTYGFTVMVNGIASALTCTVTQGSTTCNDSVHSVALTPGQTVNVRSVPGSTPTTSVATWTATYSNGSPIQ
jgi:hypothetical protein